MLLLIFGIFKTVIIQSQGFHFAFSVWKIITLCFFLLYKLMVSPPKLVFKGLKS